MENTIRLQTESISDGDLLFLASGILLEVNRLAGGIQTIVAVLLRYAAIAMSVTDSLIELIALHPSEAGSEARIDPRRKAAFQIDSQ